MEVQPAVHFDDTQIAFEYKSDRQMRKANFIFTVVNHPWISATATRLVKVGLTLRLPVKGLIRNTVFEHFCGGETIEQSHGTIDQLWKYKVGTILDYSVEGENAEEDFDRTAEQILATFDEAQHNAAVPFCVFKATGLGDMDLLEKMQSQASLSEAEAKSFERFRQRIDTICAKAHRLKIPILIDAEHSWVQHVIDDITHEMMAKYNTKKAIVFITYQMYRTDSLKRLREDFHTAAMHNYFVGIKMVRGAYMEIERARAAEKGYPDPINPTKQATDDMFNQGLAFCIDNKQRITILCGSHNEYSNQYLTVLMEKHGMRHDDKRVWFSQLLGMSDNISFNLAHAGYNVVKYVPYGPVESVMPYLLRRAAENTSVAGQSSRELTLIRKELARRKQN